MIGLGDGAPMPADLEQRDDVIDVIVGRLEVHDERRPALHPQCEAGEQRPLEAVHGAALECDERRRTGLAAPLEVDGQRVEKILNAPRRAELGERFETRMRQNVT